MPNNVNLSYKVLDFYYVSLNMFGVCFNLQLSYLESVGPFKACFLSFVRVGPQQPLE